MWLILIAVCALAALAVATTALVLFLLRKDAMPVAAVPIEEPLPVNKGGTGVRTLEGLKDILNLPLPAMIEVTGTMMPQVGTQSIRGLDHMGSEVLGLTEFIYIECKGGGVTSLRFPNAAFCGYVGVQNTSNLTSVEWPDLIQCNTIEFGVCEKLEHLSAPKLKFSNWGMMLQAMQSLVHFEFPEWEINTSWFEMHDSSLQVLELPSMRVNLGGFTILGNTIAGFSVSMPKLEQVGAFNINVTHLAGVSLGVSLRTLASTNVTILGSVSGLNQTSVDAILTDLEANTAFVGIVNVGGANAAPSVSAAITALGVRGCTVTHN